MKLTHSKSLLALGMLAASMLPVVAADPNADQILQQMSAKLAAAQNYRPAFYQGNTGYMVVR